MQRSSKTWYEMSDSALLKVIGSFLKETRLAQNKTQKQIATAAGIDRITLSRIENGKGGTLPTIISVLRHLSLLHLLQHFQTQQQISPMQLAKLEQRKRQRARSGDKGKKQKKSDW